MVNADRFHFRLSISTGYLRICSPLLNHSILAVTIDARVRHKAECAPENITMCSISIPILPVLPRCRYQSHPIASIGAKHRSGSNALWHVAKGALAANLLVTYVLSTNYVSYAYYVLHHIVVSNIEQGPRQVTPFSAHKRPEDQIFGLLLRQHLDKTRH